MSFPSKTSNWPVFELFGCFISYIHYIHYNNFNIRQFPASLGPYTNLLPFRPVGSFSLQTIRTWWYLSLCWILCRVTYQNQMIASSFGALRYANGNNKAERFENKHNPQKHQNKARQKYSTSPFYIKTHRNLFELFPLVNSIENNAVKGTGLVPCCCLLKTKTTGPSLQWTKRETKKVKILSIADC